MPIPNVVLQYYIGMVFNSKENVMHYTLVSHVLCPYVQRVAIVLAEKGIPFERIDIDLSNKPAWFHLSSAYLNVSIRRRSISACAAAAVWSLPDDPSD